MQEIPECFNRRYKVLDEFVKELSAASDVDFNEDVSITSYNEPGVRLMCDFWNILKENPDCNLTGAVQNRMNLSPKNSMFQPRNISCFMAAHNCSKKGDNTKKPDAGGKVINQCCHRGPEQIKSKCCGSKSITSDKSSDDVLPLSKVLCNLNEAASFDRKCQGMVNDLMTAQKQLQDQIQHLEHREEEGVQLLKKADCMWSCMEDAYKKKILESQERQQEMIKQLKEAEANANKWRKNKKDLEFQMENVNTCYQEISEKLQQKQNDIKCMNRDIADYKKRIENNKKEIEAAKKAADTKKQILDDKIKKISGDIFKKEAIIREEKAHKEGKETEGNQYIREARADLLNLSKMLLQKKIENEDLKTEKETLIDELEILSQSYDQCKDRCQFKKQSMVDEIKKIDNEITHYKAKCLRCHQCTDTIDIRKFCTDCPRCIEERECLYKDDYCSPDHTMDCVCMSVKQKFLDNVFENMYTVLERQIKTGPGKCVAETVLNCLKKSRNGKLDQQTRQILQDFILTTVKKNLNLTIVGGAVKTRCELDSETYKQLMLCLKQVKAVRPPKTDKQTAAKKPSCPRWGGESECNCPKGPKACICTKRAPPPPNDPGPCPPQDEEDKGEEKTCPYKESAACGPDCAMHAVPSAVGTDVAAWRPDPCQGSTCMFKNMRAAQCVLGSEALNSAFDSKSFVAAVPYMPNITITDDQISCKCGSSSTKPCICKELKPHPRERIIEEVMGKYFEVKPIDKVSAENDYGSITKKFRRYNKNIFACVDTRTRLHKINQKNAKCMACQNCNILYDDIYITERDKVMINYNSVSKYVDMDMIEKYSGHSFDTNKINVNKYLKVDPKMLKVSYPENATSVVTVRSEIVLSKKNNTKVIDKTSVNSKNNSEDTKQMKVDKRTPCIDRNCGMIRSNLFGDKSSSPTTKHQFFQTDFTVDGDVSKRILDINKSNQCNPIDNTSIDDKLKSDLINDQFRPLLITKSIQNEKSAFENNKKLLQNNIPKSVEPSKLEIDEQIIELIQNITAQDPSSFVSLKRTKSGHMKLALNSVKDIDEQSIVVKRSASGNMIIEIEKSAILPLTSDNCKELYRDKTTKTQNIGINIPNNCRPQCSTDKEISQDRFKKILLHNFKKDFSVCKSNLQAISKEFFQKMYENNHRYIKIGFKHRNKYFKNVQAILLKISENICIHVKNVNITDDMKVEFPVLLQRTESDTVYIDYDSDVITCNGVATRTDSNGFLIYLKLSNLKQLKPDQKNIQNTHDVFKIKIKGLDCDVKEPPAVIKRTPSGNFDVILEKEYEKYFQQTIRQQKIDENESLFDLTKISSTFILDFEKKDNARSHSQKALLMKSNSGLLKIIVSDATQNANELLENRKKFLPLGSMISAKTLGELLRKLLSTSKLQKNNLCKTVAKKTKSSSDSYLYETAKMKFHSSQCLLEKSSTTLKKTPSGQYAVVLDKDLKKSFIKNLLSHLDKSSNGVIPIRRTNSGEIIICLDKNKIIGECGSLKITPSGNIYIILDEGHINGISNNVAINTCNSNKNDITPYISKIDHPENKAIATNCNACPDESLCNASKCICENFNNKKDSIENSYIDSKNGGAKLCGRINCSGLLDKQNIKSNNKLHHIVIRPCESHPEPDKSNKFQESYYCKVQSICPYHKDWYEGVSNELLEISGSCNQAQKKLSKFKTYKKLEQFMPMKNSTDWNSFKYLPYQLPPFLRNFTYS